MALAMKPKNGNFHIQPPALPVASRRSALSAAHPPNRSRQPRATICLSSQAGCAVNCKFCMTALLGVQRNLTAGEIVGQVLLVLNDQQIEIGRDRINLVFMGQGEPFLNYENFMRAVRLLVEGAAIPESRMTVSTSGIVPRIADFGAEPVRPHLAISLNASNDALARTHHADQPQVEAGRPAGSRARVSAAPPRAPDL